MTAPYEEGSENKPIALSSHNGQEMDYILEGELLLSVNGRTTLLKAGDTAYYDSSQPHGMIAVGGAPCRFMAVVLKAVED